MSCKSVIKGCAKSALKECLASVPKACLGSWLLPVSKKLVTTNKKRSFKNNLSSLRGTQKSLPTCHPLSIPKGGRGGPSLSYQFRGGVILDSINYLGGRGGWRPFLWYINSIPCPNQFPTHPVNKNSSFALLELAFVIFFCQFVFCCIHYLSMQVAMCNFAACQITLL